MLNRNPKFFDSGQLKDGYSYEGGPGMVARGTANYRVRSGGGKDGLRYSTGQRTIFGRESTPTAAPAAAPQSAPAPAPKPQPKPKPKPTPKPVEYSPEIQQAKERVQTYEQDILSGKTSDSIYDVGSNSENYAKESYINRDFKGFQPYDLSNQTFNAEAESAKQNSQDFLSEKKNNLINSPVFNNYMWQV